MVPKYRVTFSSDLKNQGHPFFISEILWGTVNKLTRWKFFCFYGLLGQGSQWHVSQMRDFDAWPCTSSDLTTSDLSYLGPYACSRETLIFFVSMVCWVKEVNGMQTRYVTLTHDLVCQGHMILQVYCPVLQQIRTYLFLRSCSIIELKNKPRKQKKSCL